MCELCIDLSCHTAHLTQAVCMWVALHSDRRSRTKQPSVLGAKHHSTPGAVRSLGVCVGLLGVAEIWMMNIQNTRAMQTDE